MIRNISKTIATLVLVLIFSAPVTYANDPLTIKLDNMKNGITRLIGAVEEQRKRLETLQSDLDKSVPNEEFLREITKTQDEIDALRNIIHTEVEKIVATNGMLRSQLSDLSEENVILLREQAELKERLAQIENIFREEKQIERIVKRADGSAELFTLNSLGQYRSLLPPSEDCADYGKILQKFSNRDVNAVFVLGTGDVVQVCRLEYLMNDWQVQVATVADRAHIITQ